MKSILERIDNYCNSRATPVFGITGLTVEPDVVGTTGLTAVPLDVVVVVVDAGAFTEESLASETT